MINQKQHQTPCGVRACQPSEALLKSVEKLPFSRMNRPLLHAFASAGLLCSTELRAQAVQPEGVLPTVVIEGSLLPAYMAGSLSSPKYTRPITEIAQTITVLPKQ